MLFVILKIEVTANQHRDEIVLAPRGFRAVLRPSAGPAAVPTSHRPCPTGTSPAPWRPTPSAIPRRCSWGGPHHPSLPRVRWGRARATLGASHSQSCLSSQVSFLPDDSRLWSALRASLCRPTRLLSTATGPRAIGPRADPTAATACPASPLCPAQSHRQPHLAALTHERSGPDKCSESVTIMGFKKCVLLPQKTEN